MSTSRARGRVSRDRALPIKDEILGLLQGEDRAVHARELFGNLDLFEAAYPGLLRILDDLVFDGLFVARPGQKFKFAKKAAEGRGARVTGTLSVNVRGFGFVSSEGAAEKGARSDDVFIGSEGMGG